MNKIIQGWRNSLHKVLDFYEKRHGKPIFFIPILFFFFTILNITCYWLAIYTAFPFYMQTHEASHYIKLQIPVGLLGALFDSLSFFCNHLDYSEWFSCVNKIHRIYVSSIIGFYHRYPCHLVGLICLFFRWLADQSLEQVPEELGQRGSKYTQRAVQAIQDPTGRENLKKCLFWYNYGIICSPSYLFAFDSFCLVHTPPDTHFLQNCLKKVSMTR